MYRVSVKSGCNGVRPGCDFLALVPLAGEPCVSRDEEVVAFDRDLPFVVLGLDHEDPAGPDRDVVDVRLQAGRFLRSWSAT